MSENVMSYSQKQGKQGNDPVSAKPGKNIYRKNSSPIEQVKFLHRNLGNQAVQRLFKSGTIQAKLKIGKANDKYEQEADRVADQVMRMPEPNESLVNGHSSLVQRKSTCPECMEEEEAIQTKPIADQITPLVQRQPLEEEKEEEEEKIIQPRPIAEQITPLVQREPLDELKEEEEEEP
ncbi:MAG: hypothetical protein GTO45_28585, partial [Candidatus Aminicenantes bacterium]|nr:hypothetical protein [Candidatus Aminicenantes bacterium]NIM82755.1 hypothetical protein [Candidatus Aminicenantes bacterium]NIN22132.1 hypothetical protein [Candidatus Aminicenantes bacterium]NIN45891.1 hypothetical protein [Candidatus Aminicenantes bacterium]NIN88728.1 hypothetical protein [Candidatus Aminicenantes bacterium]